MTRLRLAAMSVTVSIMLAACGTTTAATSDTADADTSAASAVAENGEATTADDAGEVKATDAPSAPDALPEVAPDSLIPSVDVVDVRSGETVDLASIVPSEKPVLLWAWAPHCPSCRAEAGDLEEFAAANVDRLTVVGIGTQDDLDYAKGFLEDTGVQTPLMLWDESFESWITIGITAQPTWILVRGDGSFIDGWVGRLPEQRILDLLDA